MSKKDFVKLVAKKIGMTQRDTEAFMDALFETIKEQVVAGERLTIPNFGIFEVKTRPPKQGYNPHKGEKIDIPSYRVIRFKPSKNFKKLVKGQE